MSTQNFTVSSVSSDDRYLYPGYGLSKRELCAFMAMQAILSNSSFINDNEKIIANQAIVVADEMCKQLGIIDDRLPMA
jgi:hypothetical protein